VVPAFAEPDIHSLSRTPEGRHRRLSLGSLPVLKQSEESLGSLISVAQSANGRTWQPARCVIFMFFSRRRLLGRRSLVIFCGHEVPFFPIYGEQIRDHLSSYGQSRSIGIPFLLFCFVDQSQVVILSGRQLRGFHQHPLDMLVALFGKRGAHHLVGGAFFLTAEPAITDGLPDRPKAEKLYHDALEVRAVSSGLIILTHCR